MATIYTVGHSTRELADFTALLQAHSVALLVDIRAFPMSRRLPHFNRERLELWLPEAGIDYRWMKDLGGRRKKTLKDSPNVALRNDSFRNYADYMLTPEFQNAAAQVIETGDKQRAAIMCARRCGSSVIACWSAITWSRMATQCGTSSTPTANPKSIR